MNAHHASTVPLPRDRPARRAAPSPYYAYALRLQGGRAYAGSTEDLHQRLSDHVGGVGSRWTSRYPPVAVAQVIGCATREEALRVERRLYWVLAARYGAYFVRGSEWCRIRW